MLLEKCLPKKFWAEAVNTAIFLLNRLPKKAIENQIPYEAWSGIKPSASFLRVFGCICYIHVPSQKRHKLEEKSEKGIFLGYSTLSKVFGSSTWKLRSLLPAVM